MHLFRAILFITLASVSIESRSLLFAQNTYEFKSGQEITHSLYLLPHFTMGNAIFKEGAYQVYLNYNLVSRTMQFVDVEKSQILDIANPEKLIAIQVSDRHFVYLNGDYMEVIVPDDLSLGVIRGIKIGDIKKPGAYGEASSLSSTRSVQQYTHSNGSSVRLTGNEHVTYMDANQYFFLKGSKRYPATRRSLFKLYPKHKKEIEQFLRKNKLDLDQEADLRIILEYCKNR